MSTDIFKEFKEHSVAEFFRKNKHMLGYSGKIRSLTTVVHELVTNSLDACEEAGILPEIKVEIEKLGSDHYRVAVEDNGPGIPLEFIPKVFGKMLAGSKMHRFIQSRGQQGIGAAGVLLFSQITTGKPLKIKTSLGDGKIYEVEVKMNVEKNEGEIVSKKVKKGNWRGTRVEGEFKEVAYNRGELSAYEYLRRISLATPHARIILEDPYGKVVFDRVVKEMPKKPEEMKPHPHGLTVDELLYIARKTKAKKVSSMLVSELSRFSQKRIDELKQYMLRDLLLEKFKNTIYWKNVIKCYLNIDIEKYLKKFSDYLSNEEIEFVNVLINSLPESLDDLKRYALKYIYMEYLFKKLSKDEIENNKNQFKKIPENFIEWAEKNYLSTTHVNELNKKVREIVKTPKEFIELLEKRRLISKEELNKFKEKVEEILDKNPKNLSWDEAELIVNCLQNMEFMAPPTSGLRPIGAENIEKSLKDLLKPDFVKAITRNPKTYKGIPFIVEAAIAYGGNAGKDSSEGKKMEIMRFANHVPLLYDASACGITKAVKSINWRRYGIKEEAPITVFVNLISTFIPYTSAGKQAIACSENENEEIYNEIRYALMICARALEKYLSKIRREAEEEKKRKYVLKYAKIFAEALANILNKNQEEIEKKVVELLSKE
ncbi:DNA topoisomerase VI subunit B [Methanocaldococcus villosus KIN24-T80]|uniref:Type 2 DNA topoisomerase 6 subunit B n=1 Tax=Methanocaldococcus villosus KIN24-T80 TaxID=1069083 RepID=N6VRC5_9EURY|nr:DNA topoisomerase VI subunit B [Methanocaldococcus villosus]ENN96450.1 DNA topoisomerase VI subunit B [Methanocaldococcus villosus KIN24-T80]